MPDLRLERADLGHDDAQALLTQLDEELLKAYPEAGSVFVGLTGEEVAPGNGAFLVAYVGEEPVGCGAVRRISATDAEIKRMYVAPAYRNRGFGAVVLRELEALAGSLNANRVVLETGDRSPAAMTLYRSAGYREIPCYGEYVDAPLSICMAKTL